MGKGKIGVLVGVAALGLVWVTQALPQSVSQTFRARDPGVRGGPAGAGGPIAGLSGSETSFFLAGLEDFEEAEGVGDGLGPRFNLDGCAGCHLQPAVGGTSPATNPQVAVATAFGARNRVPSFVKLDGPVREARFVRRPDGSRDGGVHGLFVISGRVDETGDASGCGIQQENFEAELSRGNVIFRIPTPTFGAGLMELIPDRALLANQSSNGSLKQFFGIKGRPNRNGNDGTISRFGWKAQNVSLLLFSGEAYNVEMGITNELFQTERDETPGCQLATQPNDVTETGAAGGTATVSAVEKFAFFMRFLAPPRPSLTTPGGGSSIARGRDLFSQVGCALCHTPVLQTGESSVAALSNQEVRLYSDLLLHRMGPGLADDVSQGVAEGDEFRTAPLWGLGQRIFFLHDGRTDDLLAAIASHRSPGNNKFGPSEANTAVGRFNNLSEADKQHVLNFLRSL
jgi:CxxC motif-containing protein (DUF1111 family)